MHYCHCPPAKPPKEQIVIELFTQRIIDGLANGAIYAWLALALTIVYKSSGRLNLAQGEIATVGTYFALVLSSPSTPFLAGTGLATALLPFTPWPLWLAIIGAAVLAALMAVAIERFVIRPTGKRSATASIGLTIGILLLLNATTTYIWKPVSRGFPSPFPNQADDYFLVFGARLRYGYLGTWITLAVVLLLLSVGLTRTRFGLAFRVVSSNAQVAELMGVKSGRVLAGGWALAAAIGTLAGSIVAHRVILEPDMMVRLLIFGFAAATIGGLDSPVGAVVGGLIVGVGETLIGGYVRVIGSELILPSMLVVMVIVLLIRPSGLYGTSRVTRV